MLYVADVIRGKSIMKSVTGGHLAKCRVLRTCLGGTRILQRTGAVKGPNLMRLGVLMGVRV